MDRRKFILGIAASALPLALPGSVLAGFLDAIMDPNSKESKLLSGAKSVLSSSQQMDYKSERYGAAPTGTAPFNPNWAPSYVRWDAMVAYEQPKYAFKLNIQNLFDKLYYDAIYDNGGFVYVGQARRAILSAEYKF